MRIFNVIEEADNKLSFNQGEYQFHYGRLVIAVAIFIGLVWFNKTHPYPKQVIKPAIVHDTIRDTIVVRDTVILTKKQIPFIYTPITKEEIERFE